MVSTTRPELAPAGGHTWKDVAREAGVSPTTASLALNDHPRVSARTRKRVVEAAARLGFIRNHASRRLNRLRADSRSVSFEQVGLMYIITSDSDVDYSCLSMMRGAEQELSNVDACLLFVRGHFNGWEKVERLVRSGTVDGWLIAGLVDDDIIRRLSSLKVPHVVLADHRCTRPIHAVNIDYRAAGRMAAQHLANLGHRRIGFIGGKFTFVYEKETYEGFIAGLRELGIEYDKRFIVRGPLKHWLQHHDDPPTAIFTAEPRSSGDLLRFLAELRMEVPQQISVLGCEIVGMPATAAEASRIEYPMADIGRQGAMLLHKVVTEPSMASSDIRLTPVFVDRGSTQPLPNQTGQQHVSHSLEEP